MLSSSPDAAGPEPTQIVNKKQATDAPKFRRNLRQASLSFDVAFMM
jgi:hypothetical protein